MKSPSPLAAHLRELWLGVRLLPQAVRELPQMSLERLESNTAFWKAHTGAPWAVLLTVALLWVIVLAAIVGGFL